MSRPRPSHPPGVALHFRWGKGEMSHDLWEVMVLAAVQFGFEVVDELAGDAAGAAGVLSLPCQGAQA